MTAAQQEATARVVLYGQHTRSGTVTPAVPVKSSNKLAATDRPGSAAA